MKLTALLFFVLAFFSGASHAQSSITAGTGNALAPATGKTENLSVTSGSRTSLSVGNSTSFGASVNLTTSDGLTAVSRSVLTPSSVEIDSSIGSKQTDLGVTRINISNLTAKGGGTITPNSSGIGSGTTINSDEGQFASGDALIDGMGAAVNMKIGSTPPVEGSSTGSEASFYATVHPHIDGTACAPSSTAPCEYVNADNLTSGNAAASANLSTQTNIDIKADSFTQTFAQSF